MLVFNDNAFGAIRQYQDRVFGGRHIGAALRNPDFVKLGESFGAKSVRVEAKEVGATVRRAHQEGGLWLIEVPFAPRGSVDGAVDAWSTASVGIGARRRGNETRHASVRRWAPALGLGTWRGGTLRCAPRRAPPSARVSIWA